VGGVVAIAGIAVFLLARGGGSNDDSSKPSAPTAPQVDKPASDDLSATMKTQLRRFVGWARDNANAPCPDLAQLGGALRDPWGNPLSITCTDQPANQIIGVISAGPDGKTGTDDDIASWTLSREVTDVVRGPRWGTQAH
jgi:hypothetical protein